MEREKIQSLREGGVDERVDDRCVFNGGFRLYRNVRISSRQYQMCLLLPIGSGILDAAFASVRGNQFESLESSIYGV